MSVRTSRGIVLGLVWLLGSVGAIRAAEPPQVRTAQLFVQAHAREITGYAWTPANYAFKDIKYDGHQVDRSTGALELTFTFHVDGLIYARTATLSFQFDPAGTFTGLASKRHDTVYAPFKEVGSAHEEELRNKVKKLRGLTREDLRMIDNLNAKGLCELYLRKQ